MNVWERQYKERGFKSQREYPNESLIAFVKRSCQKGDKVLELGCGSGANIWFLGREGYEVYGIDYAKTGIEYCNKMLNKWGAKAELLVGDIKRLPYKNNFFNAIVDVVSVQHLTFSEHKFCLEEVYRCLKPGGKYFSYHLGEDSISYTRGGGKLIDKNTVDNIVDKSKPLAGNGQTCFLSENDYRNLLKRSGFKNVVVDKVTRSYNNQEFCIEYLVVSAKK
jgi:ubiquinone/menaquinone biosynthesis C-methylase UbiE